MLHPRCRFFVSLTFALLTLGHASLPAQSVPRDDIAEAIRQQRALRNASDTPAPATDPSDPVFDLDFPGGTPAEFVAAVQKAAGRPVNVIIPEQLADIRFPALRLHQISIPRLFLSISQSTSYMRRVGNRWAQSIATEFFTTDNSASAGSVWVLRSISRPPEKPSTRLFPLAYYLQHGLTVDDITTAIRTAWEMQGEAELPSIKFHQETQLLIGVGQPDQLAIIGDILEALQATVNVRREQAAATPSAKPAAP